MGRCHPGVADGSRRSRSTLRACSAGSFHATEVPVGRRRTASRFCALTPEQPAADSEIVHATMTVMIDRPSLRLAFEQQSHRFRNPGALTTLVSEACARLEADDPQGLGLAHEVLGFDPYELALHRALARFHARAGDVNAMRPHVEVEFDFGPQDSAWVSATFDDVLASQPLESLAVEVDRGCRARCRTSDLWFIELAPGEGCLTLRWPLEAQPAMVEAYLDLLTHVGRVNARLFDADRQQRITRKLGSARRRWQSPGQDDRSRRWPSARDDLCHCLSLGSVS